MTKYLAVGLLAYWAGRRHRMLSKKLCWSKLRKGAMHLMRTV